MQVTLDTQQSTNALIGKITHHDVRVAKKNDKSDGAVILHYGFGNIDGNGDWIREGQGRKKTFGPTEIAGAEAVEADAAGDKAQELMDAYWYGELQTVDPDMAGVIT